MQRKKLHWRLLLQTSFKYPLFYADRAICWKQQQPPEIFPTEYADTNGDAAEMVEPAPEQSLVDVVRDLLGHYEDASARSVLLVVADWLEKIGNNGSAADLRQEATR